jgi:hypothetical protein
MSYVVPTAELTLADQRTFRNAAIEALIARGLATGAIADRAQAVVREAENVADFGCGVGGSLTMPFAAVGANYAYFATAVPAALTPQLATNRVACFYKVNIEKVPCPAYQLLFREGAGAGTTYAVFDLEGLATKDEQDGYFTECIVYDPQRVLNIVFTARIATGVQERCRIGCFILEPTGPTIS